MASQLKSMVTNGFFKGVGLAAGLVTTGLLAAVVSGTINTFAPGETMDAARFNTNFSTLRTAIEAINPQYSTSEVATDQVWTDGKTIYRKVLNTGTLPNGTDKDVAHGITGGFTLIRLYGAARNTTNDQLTLPWPARDGTGTLSVEVNTVNVRLRTTSNYSLYTASHIVLEYTKD